MNKQALALEAARHLRGELSELLPTDQAQDLDEQIATILNASDAGVDADYQIRRMAIQYETTRLWILNFTERHSAPQFDGTRSYTKPPGDLQPQTTPRYRCPKNDIVWYRRAVGLAVPKCPTHGLELVLDSTHKT